MSEHPEASAAVAASATNARARSMRRAKRNAERRRMPGADPENTGWMRKSIVGISPARAKKRYGNAWETAPVPCGFPPKMPTAPSAALSISCWIGVAAAVILPASSSAQVYKCAGDKGVPVYQEMPCSPGKELRNFQTDPPEITILPAQR